MKSWGGDCSAYFQDKKKFGLHGGGYKLCCGSDSFVLLLMILYHLWIVVFLHFFCGLLWWFVWLIELWFLLLKKFTSVQLFSMCSVWLAVAVVDGPSLWSWLSSSSSSVRSSRNATSSTIEPGHSTCVVCQYDRRATPQWQGSTPRRTTAMGRRTVRLRHALAKWHKNVPCAT